MNRLTRPAAWSGVLFLAAALLSACADRPLRTDDIDLPDGFVVDVAVDGLDAPTMATFDEQGRMLIAESAYGGGGEPKVTRVEPDGTRTTLADGDDFGVELPVTAVAVHEGAVYVVHAGTVSTIEDGQLTAVLNDLPGQGDHQANQLVFQDGWMYLAIGTVTNSAVVGTDNAVFGWLKDPAKRDLHDVPCEDVQLTDVVIGSTDPLDDSGERVTTSAYAPYGDAATAGTTVPGDLRCNGAILRARPDGSELEVYAWGLRNPYGLRAGPDGAIYATMHGFDARGERPVENAWDCFYRVEQGAWYGFPDFACDTPVTDPQFKPIDKPQPQFLLEEHPDGTPPVPIARFDPHAATNGFDFAPSDAWGAPTDAFIALFGDFTPATGTVSRPVGTQVVRVNAESGEITSFMANKNEGRTSAYSGGGLEHPSDVTFGPDGAMYVTDWGIARPTEDGLRLEANSGVVWRVSVEEDAGGLDIGVSRVYALLLTLGLAVTTFLLMRGPANRRPLAPGLLYGAVAGLVMGGAAMLISELALNLPWYAPERVFATMVMGRDGVANILEFMWLPFVVGLGVVLVLSVVMGVVFGWLLRSDRPWRVVLSGLFFALTAWGLLQYFVLAELFPLVAERGFPPFWYGVTFAVYGLALGSLFALPTGRRGLVAPRFRDSA